MTCANSLNTAGTHLGRIVRGATLALALVVTGGLPSAAQTFSDAPVAQHLQVLLGPNARDLSRIGAICQAVPRTSPPKCVISTLKKRPHKLCR